DDRVRVGAAVALGRICDAKTVNPLIEALNDSVSMVRQLAAFSLSRIGDPRAVNPLIEALDDE
ncbi:MAG: HEAT repeat domain-containing protein, partial [Methanothrix sp.]|nr:HEAT repeat domain-containing protein [Methanothrix sp.]